jgi:hypothetical protein
MKNKTRKPAKVNGEDSIEDSERGVSGSGRIMSGEGEMECANVNRKDRMNISMKKATARNQKPAYKACAGTATEEGRAGISSGGKALGGTWTGPSCATFTGCQHCAQKLAPSGSWALQLSQETIGGLRNHAHRTLPAGHELGKEGAAKDLHRQAVLNTQ